MTRKAPASKTKSKAKPAQKPAQPAALAVYTVVRPIPAEVPTHSEPERVFATRAAAKTHADELNGQVRALTNPFGDSGPEWTMPGGEKALVALLKTHKLPVPAKKKGYNFIDWEEWWDRHYFDMTDDQREALWLAQKKYNWYTVKETTLE